MSQSPDMIHLRVISAEAAAVREFAGTDQSKHLLRLLAAIEGSYVEHIVSCKPEELTRIQAMVQQCRAIAAVVRSDPSATGKL